MLEYFMCVWESIPMQTSSWRFVMVRVDRRRHGCDGCVGHAGKPQHLPLHVWVAKHNT